jgi:hypothetical protein
MLDWKSDYWQTKINMLQCKSRIIKILLLFFVGNS